MGKPSNYCFYGAQCDRLIPDVSIQDKLRYTGMNTGNLFIYSAVEKQLGMPRLISTIGQTLNTDLINSEFDKVIIPASNFINAHSDFTNIVKVLKKINIPIIIIGLGAQGSDFNERIVLPDATKQLMHLLADRCVSMGVRGFYTAEQLFAIGIKNVDVIGCPTIFYSTKSDYKITKPDFSPSFKLAINYFRKYEIFDLIMMAEEFSSNIIFQDELFEMGIKTGETGQKDIDDYWLFKQLNKDELKKVLNFIKNRQTMFFRIDEWMEFLSTRDFSIGPRLHGNMIALQSGVPSLWFTHDTRTREICEFAKFPFINIQDLKKDSSIQELYELADFSRFNTLYPELYKNYVHFLEKNDVKHNLETKQVEEQRFNQLHEYYLFKGGNPIVKEKIIQPEPKIIEKTVPSPDVVKELKSIKASRVYKTVLLINQLFPPSSFGRRVLKRIYKIVTFLGRLLKKK